MADLVIKPSSGNLVLKDDQNVARLTLATSTGNTTFTGATTLANATITAGNLSNNNIVMPRFKEMSSYIYETVTNTSSLDQDELNISGSNYCTLTPEHTGDIIQFSYDFNIYANNNYFGFGVQYATDTGFSAGVGIAWRTGRHALGRYGSSSAISGAHTDHMEYGHQAGSLAITASSMSLSADTTYYFRMIGMTHGQTGDISFGNAATNSVKDGVKLVAKRWSIV